MTKRKTIGVMLMASSIIDKKSPRRAGRGEHRATDLRRRTRRKNPSLRLGRLHLSSRYFLKRSKIDISGNLRFSCEYCERRAISRSAVHLSGTKIAGARRVVLLVRRFRCGRGGDSLEARIVPERIEHRIEPE